jgi:hypothetical protein|tara:strand:- start:338 stop:616 length:279 start_codon:yes stop_codon:yes gene_type:complete
MTTQEELIKKSQTTKSNYEQLFKSYTGTEVLNDLSKRFFVFTSTIPTGKIDPYELAYAEGQRSVVLWLLSMKEPEEKQNPNDILAQISTEPT